MFQEKIRTIKRRLGVYRFLPLFFIAGAGIELFMIKVRIGKETFCKWAQLSILYVDLVKVLSSFIYVYVFYKSKLYQ